MIRVATGNQMCLHKHAHDSGDGQTIYHCPFCGSGQVIARSDRSVECSFCHTNFTVQVQPRYPAFPQTIDGMPVQVPGMPGQINAGDPMGMPPVDPEAVDEEGNVEGAPPDENGFPPDDEGAPPDEEEGEEDESKDEDDDLPPWMKKSFRTTAGHTLYEDDFVRHLAIRYAGDRRGMKQRIKEERGA